MECESGKATISSWIFHLDKAGYIKVELIKNDKKEIIERRIYITDISCRRIVQSIYEQNSTYPYKQNYSYPISEKAKDNNINIMIDRFFNYIINKNEELPKDLNIEQFQEFYEIIKRFEFNYTEDILNTFKEENIEKLKIIIYAIKEMFIEDKRKLLLKATRDNFLDVYDSCKKFEDSYRNTENEIRNFLFTIIQVL